MSNKTLSQLDSLSTPILGIINNSIGSYIKFNITSAKNTGISLLSIDYQEESTGGETGTGKISVRV